ncbi:DsbA family protein [Agromyces mediolanus]|uniref:DsbA family protein n=1 Tax=Agromyces mediolanus TaxID=41986 RepID=UPI00203AFD21|nr:thioredoxin domain-containing protein [Agromyces mediolanus]MCM3658867.1 DsbA family protein [Agromyces mediolanus]
MSKTPPENPAQPAATATAKSATAKSATGPGHATSHAAGLERRLRRSRILNVVLGALAAFLAVVVIAQALPGSTGSAAAGPAASSDAPAAGAPAGGQNPENPAIAKRDPDDPFAIGSVDAPIVLVEWADFRCPFCAVFMNDTMPVILDEYVDAGLVRYEFRDVAFFGDESTDAAVAARAAGEQGRFPEYLTALYAAAPESGHPDMPREKLIGFAETAGVPDLARFEADLDRPELRKAVAQSTADAQALGVTSVPFFVVGSQAMAGAQPVDAFRQFLDARLVEAGVDAPGAGQAR